MLYLLIDQQKTVSRYNPYNSMQFIHGYIDTFRKIQLIPVRQMNTLEQVCEDFTSTLTTTNSTINPNVLPI